MEAHRLDAEAENRRREIVAKEREAEALVKKTEAETKLLQVETKAALLLKRKELVDAGVSQSDIDYMLPLTRDRGF